MHQDFQQMSVDMSQLHQTIDNMMLDIKIKTGINIDNVLKQKKPIQTDRNNYHFCHKFARENSRNLQTAQSLSMKEIAKLYLNQTTDQPRSKSPLRLVNIVAG